MSGSYVPRRSGLGTVWSTFSRISPSVSLGGGGLTHLYTHGNGVRSRTGIWFEGSQIHWPQRATAASYIWTYSYMEDDSDSVEYSLPATVSILGWLRAGEWQAISRASVVSRAGAAIQVFGLGEPSTLDDSLTWFLSGPHTVSTAINWLVILGLSFVSNSLGVSTEGGGEGKTDGGMGSYGGLGRGSYISWIVGRGRFNRWRWRWRRWRFLPCWHTAWMARADPLPLQNRDTEIYRGRLHAVSGSCRGRGSGGEDFCTYIEQRRAEHSGVESVLVVPPPLTDAKNQKSLAPGGGCTAVRPDLDHSDVCRESGEPLGPRECYALL